VQLGTGVIPLDRRPAEEIVARGAVLDHVVARAITPTDEEDGLMALLHAAAPVTKQPRP
jgi:hypothetical protein